MKTFVLLMLLALALAFSPAFAAPLPATNISNMVDQNEFVMKGGICAVANASPAKPGAREAILLGGKVYQVSTDEVNKIRNAGYAKNKKTGRTVMSDQLAAACKKDAMADGCLYARARWSQLPLFDHAPGNLKP